MNKMEIFDQLQNYLLNKKKPSQYIKNMMEDGKFNEEPFDVFLELRNTEQEKKFHPEGNVLNHTLMVVDEAAKVKDESSDVIVFMWSALLHDIGKSKTTIKRNNRWTSYDHDIVGKDLAERFLYKFGLDDDFVKKVSSLIRWHMQILYVNRNLPYANLKKMVSEVSIKDISLLSVCDRMGRGNLNDKDIYDINKQNEYFVKKAQNEQKKLSFQM